MITAFQSLSIRIEEAEAIRDLFPPENAFVRAILAARISGLSCARGEIDREVAEAKEEEAENAVETAESGDDAAAADQDPAPAGGCKPPLVSRVAPSAPAPDSGQPSETVAVWTPERDAKLRDLIDSDMTWDRRFELLSALPGPPIASVGAVRVRWSKIRYRDKDAAPPAKGRPPTPEASPAPDQPTTPRAAAEPDVLATVPADDLAEAREMMRSASCGAKVLAEYFGWPLAQAQAIAAAIRDEQTRPELAA